MRTRLFSTTRLRPHLVRLATTGFLAWVVFAALLNVLKGMPTVPQELGVPYWTMTYEAGFMRRALVGTLFQSFMGGAPALLRDRILLVHVALVAGLCVGLLAWSYSLARRGTPRVRKALLVGTGAFFLSELPTTVLWLAGYLDVVLLAVASSGAYFVGRRKPLLGACIAIFGPLAHDAFVFLWLPVLLIEGRRVFRARATARRRRAVAAVPLLAPLLAAVVATRLHSMDAARQMVDRAPVSSELKENFLGVIFGQTMTSALAVMQQKFGSIPEQVALAVGFFLPPAIVIAGLASQVDRDSSRRRRVAFAALVTLAPCAVLLIAWDLSRFLLWATFAAFLLLLDNAREEIGESAQAGGAEANLLWWVDILILATLTCLSTGPHVYAYFEIAYPSRWPEAAVLRNFPSGRIAYAFLRWFNRAQFDRRYSTRDACAVVAPDAAKVDGCAFDLRPTQWLFTKSLWLSAGGYRVSVRTSRTTDLCVGPAVGEIRPEVSWMFSSEQVRPATTFDASKSETQTMTFWLNEEEASMERARVRVSAVTGCFRLEELRIEPLAE